MITLCKREIDDKYTAEKFTFITDSLRFRDEDAYAASRKFLKELGLKGDYVGWCELQNPTPEKLTEIFTKAKSEKFRIRGTYELSLSAEYESEWYELTGARVSAEMERDFYCEKTKKYLLCNIKAFTMPNNVTVSNGTLCDFSCFREDVVKATQEKGFSGIEFLWIPDIGRFEAKQFYNAFPKHLIPYCYENIYSTFDYDIKARDFNALSESSYIIAKNCTMLSLNLPLAVEKSLLPESDFAGIYSRLTQHHRLLVRKNCRDFLISQGFAKPEYFEPVIVLDDSIIPEDAKPLLLMKSGVFEPIPEDVKDAVKLKYKQHLKKVKPKRIATEKLALKALRNAKKENGDCFGKRAAEKILSGVIDERLTVYYKVANGGVISDEYTFLSVEETAKETDSFWADQVLENTEIIPENSVVFALAADGEVVLLLPDGKVARYQQGEISLSYEWPNLESFFTEETH